MQFEYTYQSQASKKNIQMHNLLVVLYTIIFYKLLYIQSCTKPSFDSLSVPSDFNLNKFLGVWYEIKWLPGTPHNESQVWRDFYQLFQLESSSTQRLLVPGKARLINDKECFSFGPWSIIANNSAKMILEKMNANATKLLNWPYYILKTDYEHYALIFSCTLANYVYSEPCTKPLLWLMSRTTSLSDDYLNHLDNFIAESLCINLTELEITPQDGKACNSSSANLVTVNIIIFTILFLIYI